jgi:hypothetical protein
LAELVEVVLAILDPIILEQTEQQIQAVVAGVWEIRHHQVNLAQAALVSSSSSAINKVRHE